MTKKQTSSPAAALLNVLGTAIIIIVIVLCLALTVPRLLGYSSYTVLTGSMEPTIPVGSVVYAKPADPLTLSVGDVIVFYDGRSAIPVTHRILENDTACGQVITKGDANAQEDLTPIAYYDIIGRVTVHIPVLGRILAPLGTMMGKAGAVAIILAGALMCEISRRLRRN
jgi:signal peptidase